MASAMGLLNVPARGSDREAATSEHEKNGGGAATSSRASTCRGVVRDFAIYFALMGACVLAIYVQVRTLPPPPPETDGTGTTLELSQVSVTSIAGAKTLAKALEAYSKFHFARVLVLFSSLCVFKYAFSLPGAMALNTVGGALYGIWAVPLCAILSASGSVICTMLSRALGGGALWFAGSPQGRVSRAIEAVKKRVDRAQRNGTLLYYMIGARLTPVLPGWLLNICAAHAGVPMTQFFLSCAIGMLPYTYITCTAGTILQDLDPENPSQLFSGSNGLKMLVAALLLLAYPLVIRRQHAAVDDDSESGPEVQKKAAEVASAAHQKSQ